MFYLERIFNVNFLIIEPDNPNRVLVKRLALVVEGRPDVVLDLTGKFFMNFLIINSISHYKVQVARNLCQFATHPVILLILPILIFILLLMYLVSYNVVHSYYSIKIICYTD